MPPRSPLPARHGLAAAWLRTPDRDPQGAPWPTMRAWLEHRMAERADVGRMLAVIEALVGQLYLVTVVAIVIGNVGRSRHRPDPSDPD